MANEDPEVVAARVADWNEHYRPQSPAAQHLVNQCVAATLLSDRCQLAHDAALADQVDEAAKDWDRARVAEVTDAWNGLAADPKRAVAAMERSGYGCRWLVARWERLGKRLDAPRLLGPGRLRRGGPALGRPAHARGAARRPGRLPAGAEQPAVPARAVGRGGRGDAGAGVPAGRGGRARAVGLRVRAGEGAGSCWGTWSWR